MARGPGPRIDLRPGPFFRAAANRLDVRSRRGFPVTVAGVVAALSFLGFLSIVDEVVEPLSLAMDRASTAIAAALRTPALTKVFWVLTLMGDSRVMVVETLVVALLLAVWGHPRRAGSVVVLQLVGLGLGSLLKALIDRPRPPASLALITEPVSASFPSGHALAGVLLFGTLALMLAAAGHTRPWVRAWGAVAIFALTLAIGLSRVYLGVHYFSDVLASWLLGTAMLATWAAAVLVWGRTHPIAQRVMRPLGAGWWRWLLVALGSAGVIVAIVAESAVTKLR